MPCVCVLVQSVILAGAVTRVSITVTHPRSSPVSGDCARSRSGDKGIQRLMRVRGVEQASVEFAEFYESARDDCLRVVLLNVGDRLLAEELVAEGFARAWMA